MRLSIISFTQNGLRLGERLGKELKNIDYELFYKCSYCVAQYTSTQLVDVSVGQWAREQFEKHNALLFIGACGIAVRAIAPCITDKLHDSPVLVMDEQGQYVIPLLSGHVGGANELAVFIAQQIGAEPVITTATDRNHKFAVDLFAGRNELSIVNKDGIAKVSAKVLAGQEITVSVEPGHWEESDLPEGIRLVDYPPGEPADVVITSEGKNPDGSLFLKPREYIIGVGCKKGKEADKLEEFISRNLQSAGISLLQVAALVSIDVKKQEHGLLAWSTKQGIPFLTYSAGELRDVSGDFHASRFVEQQVGVDNVCERAALKAAGQEGTLVLEKQAEDGMTMAIARRKWSVNFNEV